jgi:hypothetical protein
MRGLVGIVIFLLIGTSAQAASVQARLIRATNEPGARDERLQDIEPKLKRKFGYDNYQQLGVQKETLVEGKKLRLNLGEGFVVFVHVKPAEQRIHKLDVELFSGRASVMKTTVNLGEKCHLFAGPVRVGNDWLVLSLAVVD